MMLQMQTEGANTQNAGINAWINDRVVAEWMIKWTRCMQEYMDAQHDKTDSKSNQIHTQTTMNDNKYQMDGCMDVCMTA